MVYWGGKVVKMKILFYISSLIPLSILIFLKTFDFENLLMFLCDWKFYCYFIVPIMAFIALLIICMVRGQIDQQRPVHFTNIQPQNVNFLAPISIYFIPFISSNFHSPNDWFVTIFIIIFVGLIVIKTNLQYLNPLIIVFGFNLYIAHIKEQEVFILSKAKLSSGFDKKFNIITDNLYKI